MSSRLVIGLAAASAALELAACTPADHSPKASATANRFPTVSASKRADCRAPTATAATDRPIAVGASGAPSIGPFTFHPYQYVPGDLTKMIIHVARPQPRPAVLTGFRCSDGRVLRFSYDDSDLPAVPLTGAALTTAGNAPETLGPTNAGADHTGYALFSATGTWLIAVSVGGREIGTLSVDVVRS